MIRLFTTIYDEPNLQRLAEYRTCLERNISCPAITEICVLCEGDQDLIPHSEKIRLRRIDRRPTYTDFFNWINELVSAEDVSIIANTDIYFDNQLYLFQFWRMPSKMVLALSRWDRTAESIRLHNHGDSQDSWIVKGNPQNVDGCFFIGVPRCDNRIAAEFEKAGYRVTNPSFSIRSYHLHQGEPRRYLEAEHSRLIPPPYKYISPHNLISAISTLAHNWRHPGCKLAYRIDWCQITKSFPMRQARNLLRGAKSVVRSFRTVAGWRSGR